MGPIPAALFGNKAAMYHHSTVLQNALLFSTIKPLHEYHNHLNHFVYSMLGRYERIDVMINMIHNRGKGAQQLTHVQYSTGQYTVLYSLYSPWYIPPVP